MTYTYAVLQVSSEAYQEIKSKLEAAGYNDVLHETDKHGVVIDMHGLALANDEFVRPLLDALADAVDEIDKEPK